jgi:hypothetical protein
VFQPDSVSGVSRIARVLVGPVNNWPHMQE